MTTIKILATLCMVVAVVSACDNTGLKTCMDAMTQQMGKEIQSMVQHMRTGSMSAAGLNSLNKTIIQQALIKGIGLLCNQQAAVESGVTCFQNWISASCSEMSQYLKYVNVNGIVGAYNKMCTKTNSNEYVFFTQTALKCLESKEQAFETCATRSVQSIVKSETRQPPSMDEICTVYDSVSGCTSKLDEVTEGSPSCGLAQYAHDIILAIKPTACGCTTIYVSIWLMVGAVLLGFWVEK